MVLHRRYWLLALISILIFTLVWFALPAYQFFAHRGKAPMLPAKEFQIPDETPSSQKLYLDTYGNNGDDALELLKQHKLSINSPAISAAVSKNGMLIWAGSAGWADIAANRPANTETRFRIGSSSKAVTGSLLARLVDKERMDLDAPLSEYFPALPNIEWSDITARQLASHSAGIVHYNGVKDKTGLYHLAALQKHFDSPMEAIRVFDATPLMSAPGTRFSYSSLGTVLLSAAIEQQTGQSFLELLQSEVLNPANMNSTMAEDANDKNLAKFYWNKEGKQSQVREWRKVDLSQRLAAGGLVSNPSDLVKLGSAFLKNEFIGAETREEFWAPQRLSNGEVNPQNYALGWRKNEHILADGKTYKNANHGGVSRGSQCWLMVIPELQLSVAVMINANTENFWDFGKVSMDLASLFLTADTATNFKDGNTQ